jgi:uncharacterized RDD family membrane protein YckC
LSTLPTPPITGPPAPLPVHLPNHRIGALWRRFVAFLIDSVILGIAGSLIALPFFSFFCRLGAWGRLVGLCIALSYFAILESSVGNGQTLGKRWLGLRVVDRQGSTIPFSKSLVRYLLFAIPYFANEIPLPISRTPVFVSSLLGILVFGLGGATFYLLLFNRRMRQGVHDLAAGSYVVDDTEVGALQVHAIWGAHWIILSVVIPVLVIAVAASESKLADSRYFSHMFEDVRIVESIPGVQSAGVLDLTQRGFGGNSTQRILVVTVRWMGPPEEQDAAADQIAKQILQHDAEAQTRDALRIAFVRGYDLGIAHGQVARTFAHTPAEWNERISGTKPGLPNDGTKL